MHFYTSVNLITRVLLYFIICGCSKKKYFYIINSYKLLLDYYLFMMSFMSQRKPKQLDSESIIYSLIYSII